MNESALCILKKKMNYKVDKKDYYEDDNFSIPEEIRKLSLEELEYLLYRFEEFHELCKKMVNCDHEFLGALYSFCADREGGAELLISYLEKNPNSTEEEIAEYLFGVPDFVNNIEG